MLFLFILFNIIPFFNLIKFYQNIIIYYYCSNMIFIEILLDYYFQKN